MAGEQRPDAAVDEIGIGGDDDLTSVQASYLRS
jgi:hypothetical protein